MADSTFRAGGLASGMDTNSIVDQLVNLEQRPMDLLRQRQSALKTQVSTIGDILAKLSDFKTAIKSLSDAGTIGTKVTSTNTGFSAVSGSAAVAGSYSVTVGTLAQSAGARSQAFAAETSPVKGGTLTLNVMGTDYNMIVPDGAALSDVALLIRQSGAPVSAVVLSNGTNAYLSITNRNSGHPIGGVPADALTITEIANGDLGQPLSAAMVQTASNASVEVNGLTFTRQSNTLADVIPGVTMTLKGTTVGAETLTIDNDTDGTATNLKKLVDTYNNVMKALQKQLQVTPESDRSTLLAGDAALRGLQRKLQSLLTSEVGGSANVRTLADVGVKTARDGSISLDTTILAKAITRDAGAVNNLFSLATTGLSALATKLVDNATNATDGTLVSKRKGLSDNIKSIDTQLDRMQIRLDAFRLGLINQFTAMEKVVSNMKSIGNFLTQQTQAGVTK
jgi:flagellar hook-associated protein 2